MEKSTLSIKETLSITFRTLKILFHAAPGGIAFLGILSTIAGVCPFLTLILSRAFLDSLARACGQQAFEMEIIWLLFSLFLTNMMLSVVNMISFSSSPPEREKRKIICKCKPKSKIFLC